LRATRGRGAAPSLSAKHGPLRAVRGRGPATAAGLQWTCGPDSFAGGQRNLIDSMFDFKFKLNFHILKLSLFWEIWMTLPWLKK
jgi:hypothetical protein